MQIVWIARIFGCCIFLLLGGVVHYLIFFSNKQYLEIITSHIYMHIIYILISLLLAEHFLNFLKKIGK
jgi:hypothetical protein